MEQNTRAVKISNNKSKIKFEIDSGVLISKVIDGRVPDYNKVIPKDNDKILEIKLNEFKNSIERVTTVSSDRKEGLKMSISKNSVQLSVNSPNSGERVENINAKFNSSDLNISFNSRYLTDIASQIENDLINTENAMSYVLECEKEQKRNVVNENTFAIVASRIGFETQMITAGKFSNLLKINFGEPPHSLIITGKLHFTESDAMKVLTECLDKPLDNSNEIKSISIQMIEKYVPMVREALEEIKPFYNNVKEYQEILQNAELYINDAENFLKQGKDENAILSIGYADGLVDALRMAKGIEPKM